MKLKSRKTFFYRNRLILKDEIIEVTNNSTIRYLIEKHKFFAVSDAEPATQKVI